MQEKYIFVNALDNAVLASDIEYFEMMVNGWTGVFLFERFFFLNLDFMMFFWMLCMIGMGVFIGGRSFFILQTGYSAIIMTRVPYRKYIKTTLIAQSLYMLTFFLLVFAIFFICIVIFGGGDLGVSPISRLGDIDVLTYYLFLAGIILYSTICMITLILISSVSPLFLKNKYMVQFFPIFILLGGYVFAFIFGNINELFRFLSSQILFERSYFALIGVISPFYADSPQALRSSIIICVSYPLLIIIALFVIYRFNVRKFEKNCII